MPGIPTIHSVITDLEIQYADAAQRRKMAQATARDILGRAEREGRSYVTPDEDARIDKLIAARDSANREQVRLAERLAEAKAVREDEERRARDSQIVHDTGVAKPAYDRVARIGYESRTYRPDEDPHGKRFLLDVCQNFLHADPAASERLQRHMAEERVDRPGGWQERAAGDTTTGNWAGLTVPAYLTNLVADQIGALRPFADLCCVHVPLPPAGMQVNFSKVTTGTTVGLQSAELGTVTPTSIDDTVGQASVQTALGTQNVSRQAIERGTGIEDTTWRDLARKYATTLDSTLLTQATTGLSAVAQTVTYTSASPTGAEFYPYVYQASSKLEAALLGVAYPSHVVMHSRRWNWYAAQVGSTWPLVNAAGVPAQSGAFSLNMGQGGDPPQVRAVLASGLKVVVDNNVLINGSSQDEVYVVAGGESMYLAEDPNAPLQIRAEQPNAAQLGVLLVLYSYFAYFTRYANPASKIVGTGTAAPTGF